jgi:large subunit ribosomal protein L3
MKCILAKKIGMTTIYDEEKGSMNVTLLECMPNVVNFIRTMEKDGYSAIQLGVITTGSKTESKAKKDFTKLKEFRIEAGSEAKVGDKMEISQFTIGEKVKISGITKAKGFQGVMKRHNFHGSPKSHGRKHDWRAPGSIGSSFPEHVLKGKKMAGRMGGTRSSIKNLKVAFIDAQKNILGVKGPVPGVSGRLVEIVSAK